MNLLNSLKPTVVLLIILIATGCSNEVKQKDPEGNLTTDPKVGKLRLPSGFHAEHLFGPSENGEGSWFRWHLIIKDD